MSDATEPTGQPVEYLERKYGDKPLFSIQKKIMLALFLIAGIPFFALFIATSLSARDYLQQDIGQSLSVSAKNKLVQLHAMFRYSVEDVQAWSMHSVMKDVLINDRHGRINTMLRANQQAHHLFNGIFVTNWLGEVVASTDDEVLGINVSDRLWFKDTLENRETQIGQLRFDLLFGGYGITISQPIFSGEDKSKVIGVLNASFSWRRLLGQLDQVDIEKINSDGSRHGVILAESETDDSFVIFLDHDGYVVAAPSFVLYGEDYEGYTEKTDRYRVSDINLRELSLQDAVKDHDGQGYVTKSFGSKEYLIGFSTTPAKMEDATGIGWYVLVFKDSKSALSPLNEFRQIAILLAIVAFLLILAGAAILSNNLSRPILRINEWAKVVAAGKFDEPIAVETNDEIGMLATSVHQLRLRIEAYIDRVSLQNRELAEKERELDQHQKKQN